MSGEDTTNTSVHVASTLQMPQVPIKQETQHREFLSLLSEGAIAHSVPRCLFLIVRGREDRERVCVNMRVSGDGGGGNPKLHNPNLEDSFHLKKKLHIPYSQASYSQTDDEGNRKAGGEGEPCTHPHRGEDTAWQQPPRREEFLTDPHPQR